MRVLVCGAGVIGLATALLLAGDGHEVTVLEQDGSDPPEQARDAWEKWARQGVAQWHQPHNLFPRFQQILDADLPEVSAALVAAGCAWSSPLESLPPSLVDRSARPEDEAFRYLSGRRPVVEAAFADLVRAHPAVQVHRGSHVVGLLTEASEPHPVRVTGVRTDDGEEHRADLVLDAMGRQSHVARWLQELGAQVQVQSQDQGFVYYTRYLRGSLPSRIAPPLSPMGSFSLLTIPGDADTWSVTLFATAHDALLKQVRDVEKFTDVVQACPLHAHWLTGSPITGVLPMGGVLDRHRRFVVDGVPACVGLLAVGDAWACTNPSAGRGLSVGLVHAQLLRDVLRRCDAVDDDLAVAWDTRTEELVAPFFYNQQRADRYRIAEMAAERDDRPSPQGDPVMTRLISAAMKDPDVFRAYLETVMCMALPQEVLQRPFVRQRVEELGTDAAARLPGPSRRELVDLLS